MKALLIKDFYVITKHSKMFLGVIIIFSLINDASLSFLGVLFGAALPITAVAYDEHSNFNKLSKVYPYSAFDITLTKYVLGYACLGLSLLISFVSQTFFSDIYMFDLMNTAVLIGGIMIAFNIPIMFKFGSEKGRMIFMFMIVMVSILGNILIEQFSFPTILDGFSFNMAFALILVGILNLISILISTKINKAHS